MPRSHFIPNFNTKLVVSVNLSRQADLPSKISLEYWQDVGRHGLFPYEGSIRPKRGKYHTLFAHVLLI